MIVELVTTDSGPNLCLLHFNPKKDDHETVNRLADKLQHDLAIFYKVSIILNGEPCPTNPLPKIILFNADNPVLLSIVKKISEQAKPGAMIPLTAEEMDVWVKSQPTDWTTI